MSKNPLSFQSDRVLQCLRQAGTCPTTKQMEPDDHAVVSVVEDTEAGAGANVLSFYVLFQVLRQGSGRMRQVGARLEG